jgi:DNA-binding beta-propeller fold protein YncE
LIFTAISDHSEISVIDAAEHKLLKQYPLPQCDDASGLALDSETGVLLVTCANLKAITLDSHTGRILGTTTIAKYPDLIAFDPVRHVFYVPCIPGTLFVIAEDKAGAPQIQASVMLASGVHTEALDAEGGLLYVPAGNIIFPKKGERPGVEPGTFKLLVVDVKEK